MPARKPRKPHLAFCLGEAVLDTNQKQQGPNKTKLINGLLHKILKCLHFKKTLL